MTLIVERKPFIRALHTALRAAERRAYLPSERGVRLMRAAGTDGLRLVATDGDIWLSQTLLVTATKDEEIDIILLDVRDVCRALQQLGGWEVRMGFEQREDRFDIESGGVHLSPPVMKGEDAPNWPAARGLAGKAEIADWPAKLRQVAPAISTEETRYYLNGVFLTRGETAWHFIATDGHRLFRTDVALQEDEPLDFGARKGIIIPRGAVHLIAGLCRRAGVSDVYMGLFYGPGPAPKEGPDNPCLAQFVIGPFSLAVRLIDGDFPDYERVIPKETTAQMCFSRGALVSAVEGIASNKGYSWRALILAFGEDAARIYRYDEEGYRAHTDLAAEGAVNLRAGCNAHYLKQALGALPQGCARARFSFPPVAEGGDRDSYMSPFIIQAEDGTGPIIVQMPMRQ